MLSNVARHCQRPCPLRRSAGPALPKGALGEEAKPYGISKASPFGRGVTEGDGEGKPVAKRLLTQRWASAFVKAIGSLCKSFHSGILALSGASRQLSQRESLGRRGEASRNIQSLSLWKGVTGGDGEGKPVTKRMRAHSDRAGSLSSDVIAMWRVTMSAFASQAFLRQLSQRESL